MNSNIKNISQIAILTAVLCVLSPLTLTLPVSPIPISLANFVIYIFAIILGTKKALFGIVIYILLGIVGLPVFSKGGSGIGYVFGPTGGYLIGYLFCSLGASLGNEIGQKYFENSIIKIIILALGLIIGTVLCYALGTIWLSYCNNLEFSKALFAGVIPFIPGDLVKIILAIIITAPLKERLKKFIN